MTEHNEATTKKAMTVGAISIVTGFVIGGGLQQIEHIKNQPPKVKPTLTKWQRYKKRYLQKGQREYTAYVLLRNDIKQTAIKNARIAKEQPSQNL